MESWTGRRLEYLLLFLRNNSYMKFDKGSPEVKQGGSGGRRMGQDKTMSELQK